MLDTETIAEIRRLLADNVGRQLTPDLCHLIDQAARFTPDRSIDLAQFQSAEHLGCTIRAERFETVLPELHPLHELHWQETEKHRHGVAMRPDYQAMAARERAGGLLQFVARDAAGAIAGHVRMYVGTSLHSQTLFAEEDTLFMVPEHRRNLLVMALMRYAEQCLRQIGVREIRADSKLLNRADVLMKRMGYTAVALKFHKIFED